MRVTVSFMDKFQSSVTDRFSKCASIVKGGGRYECDRDARAYVVPQLAKKASVWKVSTEREGRRKKIEKMNEKRKSKNQKGRGPLAVGVKTKAANNDRKLPPTLQGKTRRAHVLKNTENAENGLKRRSKR